MFQDAGVRPVFRLFCAVSLYTALGMLPAAAQLITPSGGARVSPCDAGARPSASAAFPCGVILYSPTGSVSSSELAARARGAGANVRFEYRSIAGVAARVSDQATLRSLAGPGVVLIPDRPVNAIAKPGGGGSGGGTKQIVPAGVTRIGGVQSGGTGVGVAIIDTGLDLSHADFKRPTGDSAIAASCFDAYGGNCMDQNGHGTHVGGIVAAQNNGIDVVGVAPNVTLYAVRVLDSSGSGYDTDIIAGLDWIWNENGGDTVSFPLKISVGNMSLGRAGKVDDDPALLTAVQRLTTNQGVTLVVAAGNDPRLEISQQVPAAYKEVLAIASTAAVNGNNVCNRLNNAIAADTASYFTTDGKDVAISAPGEDQENVSRGCLISSVGILSLKLGGGTVRMSGTSMAAPHAAAFAALVYGQSPTATNPNTVRSKMQDCRSRAGVAPLDSPTSNYTYDGTKEGILSVSCL